MYCLSKWSGCLWILIIGGVFSCTKEQDITSTSVTMEEPRSGEIIQLSGIVRDTAEVNIDNVALRVKIGDFQEDFTTDDAGRFELELPAVGEQVLIVADKSDYNRSIQTIDLNSRNIRKDIYLLKDALAEPINLEIKEDQLFYIRGRMVDQFNDPLPNLIILGDSNIKDGREVKYSVKTDDNGFFEMVAEQEDFEYHFVFTGIYEAPCYDNFFEFRPHLNDTLLDLGDLVFPISATYQIQPEVDVSDCSDISYVNHIYRPGDINVFKAALASGQRLTFCDTSTAETWLYNGILSADASSFNGQFQRPDDFSTAQTFDLCTPEGKFVELRFENATMLFNDPEYDANNRMIRVSDGSTSFSIQMTGSFSSSLNGVSYDYSRVSLFTGEDTNGTVLYTLDDDGPQLVNRIGGSLRVGVLTARIKWSNGRTELVTVRFRV